MLPESLRRVVALLSRLPGVGGKTAQRYALHLLSDPELACEMSEAFADLPNRVRPCEQCNNIAEVEDGRAVCSICADNKRDSNLLCVLAKIQDLLAIERSGVLRGRYFVLGNLLSPLDGVGPDELPLEQMHRLIEKNQVREVILATPQSVEGEATALFLARELNRQGIATTRIASGIPHGGDLEYLDQITLGRAIDGRRSLETG